MGFICVLAIQSYGEFAGLGKNSVTIQHSYCGCAAVNKYFKSMFFEPAGRRAQKTSI
jgi:hypothetical protein